ncbi:MAG: rhomboid family intramembrane serine protease [Firmicutes bacterium]|nr:rhomboid family intramembrane serine protease [Bacillota bacterium]
MNIFSNIHYNSVLILSYFFISLIALILNTFTGGKTNKVLFSSYRSSPLNPLTYIRFFTHALGHTGWHHFSSNFLTMLLIGPMIEEKYGTINLLIMMVITAGVTGIINTIISKKAILGASGNVFMLIMLSSMVNLEAGKIPLTLILIFFFYIANEIIEGIFVKDNVSHMGHIIGAICGVLFGFYWM